MESKQLTIQYVEQLNKEFKTSSIKEVLRFILEKYGSKSILASSLGLEDQLLTYEWLSISPNARIFVLDTGRLNQETYDVMESTMKQYSFNYEVYQPDASDIKQLIEEKGHFSFYKSIENRKECCYLRKTKQLNKVLKTVDVWITGLRIEQSVTRKNIDLFEIDTAHNILKVNPLINWTYNEVYKDINAKDIPYNVLHDKGYPSIGCEPCTRAIKDGEDSRAGRWWWEAPEQKECGIHISNGKIIPKKNKEVD